MNRQDVLALLASGKFVSGEAISRQFGVSRAAVWKAVAALRQDGYEIESVTNRGYRLAAEPDRLNSEQVRAHLQGHPWQELVEVLPVVDSTNTRCKLLAASGAPAGTTVIADSQTGGRGRRGRSFASPPGMGVYLSAILRPHCAPEQLTHLTALTAVAVCDAIAEATGLQPGIKWTNDIVLDGRKLCGILTELSIEAETGGVQYAVIGIGVNCNQQLEDFPEELWGFAGSLSMASGHRTDRSRLAAALVRQLQEMDAGLLVRKQELLARYAERCVTIGSRVRIVRADEECYAQAVGIDENAALRVVYDDGSEGVVNTGEVSVRGMYGYV